MRRHPGYGLSMPAFCSRPSWPSIASCSLAASNLINICAKPCRRPRHSPISTNSHQDSRPYELPSASCLFTADCSVQ